MIFWFRKSLSILKKLRIINLILLHNGLNNEGWLICKSIKGGLDTKHIPVIMSSTLNDLPQIAEESCAEGYIQKPFDIEDFLILIRKTLEQKKPHISARLHR